MPRRRSLAVVPVLQEIIEKKRSTNKFERYLHTFHVKTT